MRSPPASLAESHVLPGTASRHNIAVWHERLGKSADEIATEYDLTLADVYAALAYYFDHREEIDREIEESQGFAEALRQANPSKVEQKLREQKVSGEAGGQVGGKAGGAED